MKIEYDKLIYKRVELINNDGKLIQVVENDFLNISLLTNGFYYLNFYNNTADKIISKKILIIH